VAAPVVSFDGQSARPCPSDRHFDDARGQRFWQRLDALLAELGWPALVPDCEAVGALGCFGPGRLVALHGRVRAGGGKLTLVQVRPHVHEMLALTRLTTLLDVRLPEAASRPRRFLCGHSFLLP
jgi:anti-anti-sigma factor